MDQECPAGVGILDCFRKRAVERKGRPSIDALDTVRGSGDRSGKGSAEPSSKSKKRSREGVTLLPPPTLLSRCRNLHLVGRRSRWTRTHKTALGRRSPFQRGVNCLKRV